MISAEKSATTSAGIILWLRLSRRLLRRHLLSQVRDAQKRVLPEEGADAQKLVPPFKSAKAGSKKARKIFGLPLSIARSVNLTPANL